MGIQKLVTKMQKEQELQKTRKIYTPANQNFLSGGGADNDNESLINNANDNINDNEILDNKSGKRKQSINSDKNTEEGNEETKQKHMKITKETSKRKKQEETKDQRKTEGKRKEKEE